LPVNPHFVPKGNFLTQKIQKIFFFKIIKKNQEKIIEQSPLLVVGFSIFNLPTSLLLPNMDVFNLLDINCP
jgi:hypothetical protein